VTDPHGDRGEQATGQQEQSAKREGAAYQGALEAVFAILIAGGIGYWADGYFGMSPWLLILGFVIGFGSFVLRLLRMGRQLNASAPPADDAVDTKPGGR
jgi:F0F1-type ATP synthase assembly protein I